VARDLEVLKLRRGARRFFAVVLGRSGYALDYYPEERARYLRQERKNIVGDYATVEEARAAVEMHLHARFCGEHHAR
jgi:hypothetical protein